MTQSVEAAPRSRRGRSSEETRGAVLDLIRSSGEISRVELARRSALTEATISKAVKALLADGVIVEAGQAESTGGKRPTLLRLGSSGRWAVGVILDHFRIVAVLCGIDGSLVAAVEVEGAGDDEPDVVLGRVAGAVEELLDDRAIAKNTVIGLGVAISGRRPDNIDWTTAPPEDWWEQVAVDEELNTRTGLNVLLENDANCAALGEFWSGRVPDDRDFALIYMAYGVGAGVIVDGDIYRGRTGHSGEIGHTFVDPDQTPCWCGSVGCLNMVGSPQGIVRRATLSPEIRGAFDIAEGEPVQTVYAKIAAAYEEGSTIARDLIESAAEFLGTAVVNVINTLDLDRVVFAGPGFAAAPEAYMRAVKRHVEASYMHSIHPVELELRATNREIAALGAASLVLHRSLTPHLAS